MPSTSKRLLSSNSHSPLYSRLPPTVLFFIYGSGQGDDGDDTGPSDAGLDAKARRQAARAGRGSVAHYAAVIASCGGDARAEGLAADEAHLLEQSLFTAARHYHRICSLEGGDREAALKAVDRLERYAERVGGGGEAAGGVRAQQMEIAREMAMLLRMKYRL